MRVGQFWELDAQLLNLVSQCIDTVHGCELTAAGGPELIAVEIGGQGFFLHGFNQFSELSARFQPFGDAQKGDGLRFLSALKPSQPLVFRQDCNKVITMDFLSGSNDCQRFCWRGFGGLEDEYLDCLSVCLFLKLLDY